MKKETLILFGKDLGRLGLLAWGVGLALASSAWAAVIIGDPHGPEGLSIWRMLVVVALASVVGLWLLALSSGVVRLPRAVPWRRFVFGLVFVVSFWIIMSAFATFPYVIDQTHWLLNHSNNQVWAYWPTFYVLSATLVAMGTAGYVVWLWLGRDVIPIDLAPNKRPAQPEAELHS